jgi:hypothetical protein
MAGRRRGIVMLRWVAIFGCAFALAITASMGFEAEAAKGRSKQCVAAGMSAAKTKWKCKAAEKCCFDWIANKGTCVPASGVCL